MAEDNESRDDEADVPDLDVADDDGDGVKGGIPKSDSGDS